MGYPNSQGLYDPINEHDACGVGMVAHIKGEKSHAIIEQALQILERIDHRGAVGADPLLGDGAGLLMQIPDPIMRKWAGGHDIALPPEGEYGVAMCFMPQNEAARAFVTEQFEKFTAKEGQVFLGWRDVPTTLDGLGDAVIASMPVIQQAIIGKGPNCEDQDAFERKLLVIRKQVQNPLAKLEEKHDLQGLTDLYMPSFSSRTIVYKGLLLCEQVRSFYDDLRNPDCVSALGLVHQRFSTNTFPSWRLAHPFRLIAHNGEINTNRGNVNWMNARRRTMESDLLGPDLDKMWPIIPHGQSDTACLDNALELLLAGGYSLAHAMMMLIPEAWAGNALMDPDRRAFYEYHAALMEPWDGPAAVCFTDGRQIGATLDRNGLRPARFCVTKDDIVCLASESGVLPFPEEDITRKWRLQPGKMLLIDLEEGRIVEDEELKAELAQAEPYADWLEQAQYKLADISEIEPELSEVPVSETTLLQRQKPVGAG
ncbi:MAG: glutamate synthase subunit alpha, partial [Pseudomonadota bacterium]